MEAPRHEPEPIVEKPRLKLIEQRVIIGRPPVFDECRAKFGPRVDAAIFSWGDVIYNPGGNDIPPALMAHEAAHGARQVETDIEAWWRRYIDDEAFRIAEEVPAHVAEYLWLARNGTRNYRRAALKHVAKRMAGPIYGHMVTVERAKRLIREAA